MEPRRHPPERRKSDRRLQVVERKVERLLDPETGIYAKLDDVEQRLRGWAIAILTSVIVAILLLVVSLAAHHG